MDSILTVSNLWSFVVGFVLTMIFMGFSFWRDLLMLAGSTICYWWRVATDELARREHTNAYLEARIKRIEKKGRDNRQRAEELETAKAKHERLQQKMVDVCYEHPDEWLKQETNQ